MDLRLCHETPLYEDKPAEYDAYSQPEVSNIEIRARLELVVQSADSLMIGD